MRGDQRLNLDSGLAQVPIPVPTLIAEQRAIATALSDVDALLGGLDRLIAKKRDLKQAAMQQLLTGQTRLPGFHGEWEVKRVGRSPAYCPDQARLLHEGDYVQDGTPIGTSSDLADTTANVQVDCR